MGNQKSREASGFLNPAVFRPTTAPVRVWVGLGSQSSRQLGKAGSL